MVRMWQLRGVVLFLAASAASAACAQPFRGETIAIATDTKGIGFDDLVIPMADGFSSSTIHFHQ